MIKVCSLDFLNDKSFEADVKTNEGKVLFQEGDKITPEILLKLYFRDIYINEPIKETVPKTKTKEDELGAFDGDIIVNAAMGAISTNSVIDGVLGVVKESADSQEEPVEKEAKKEKKPKEEKEEAEEKVKEPVPAAIEEPKENPDDIPLEFDEEKAKRIIELSSNVGQLLKFTSTELKELEQVAYYCNIGITKFKKGDLKKKGFNKRKAFESYQELIDMGTVSNSIAEMVKYSANNYESESFPLNAKVPYNHIVAMTSFYDDYLEQTKSKKATLLKMMEMGSNHFNTFILHKFIKMMKEKDE